MVDFNDTPAALAAERAAFDRFAARYAGQPMPGQDFVVLAGKISPGLATVTGAGSPRAWDVRKSPGANGAWVVYMGRELAKFDIVIDLWKPQHFDEWKDFASILTPISETDFRQLVESAALSTLRGGASPGVVAAGKQALGISHPLLLMPPLYITACVITDVSQFEVSDEGLYTCRISCLEFRVPQPLPVLVRPQSSTPAEGPKAPTARDAAEEMILGLNQTVADLSKNFR